MASCHTPEVRLHAVSEVTAPPIMYMYTLLRFETYSSCVRMTFACSSWRCFSAAFLRATASSWATCSLCETTAYPPPKQGDHGRDGDRDDPGAATVPPLRLGERLLLPGLRCRRACAGEGRGAGGCLGLFSPCVTRCVRLCGICLRGVALVRHVAHLEDVARADLWLGVPAARGVVVFRVRAHDFLRPSGNVQARMSLLEA